MDKLKAWFGEILPDYSRDKVYVSDMKKVAAWYNILHMLDMLVKEEPAAETAAEPEEKGVEATEAEKEAPAASKKKKQGNPKPGKTIE